MPSVEEMIKTLPLSQQGMARAEFAEELAAEKSAQTPPVVPAQEVVQAETQPVGGQGSAGPTLAEEPKGAEEAQSEAPVPPVEKPAETVEEKPKPEDVQKQEAAKEKQKKAVEEGRVKREARLRKEAEEKVTAAEERIAALEAKIAAQPATTAPATDPDDPFDTPGTAEAVAKVARKAVASEIETLRRETAEAKAALDEIRNKAVTNKVEEWNSAVLQGTQLSKDDVENLLASDSFDEFLDTEIPGTGLTRREVLPAAKAKGNPAPLVKAIQDFSAAQPDSPQAKAERGAVIAAQTHVLKAAPVSKVTPVAPKKTYTVKEWETEMRAVEKVPYGDDGKQNPKVKELLTAQAEGRIVLG